MSTATTQIIISGRDELSGVVANAGRRLGTEIQGMQRGFASIGSSITSLTGLLGGVSIGAFAQEVLQAGIALDSLRRSFVAISGSQLVAGMEMEFLRSEAGRLGQSFYDLAPAYKSLAAAARGTSLEGENTRKIFSAVSEAATALGMSTPDTEGALRAIGQMMSKGNVQAEELRGQLGERLPSAFKLMADALGVSQAQLNKMLEKGEVLAEDALPKLAAEIHKAYGAAAETAALESGQAAVNRLSEEWSDLKVNLYSSEAAVGGMNSISEALEKINNALDSMGDLLEKPLIQKWFGAVGWTADKLTDVAFYIPGKIYDAAIGPQNSIRRKVNRDDVAPAYVAPAVYSPVTAGSKADAAAKKAEKAREKMLADGKKAEAAAKKAEKAREKMLADGKKAEAAIEAWGEAYEQRRIDAIAASVDSQRRVSEENLELQTEFAERYKEVVLGETAFKMAQIEAQADAYRRAGVDEVALAQYVAAEKLKYSREWQDGAIRALQAYADEATNAAAHTESFVTDTMGAIQDGLKQGIMDWNSWGDAVENVLDRVTDKLLDMALDQVSGPLAAAGGDFFKYLFGGGSSVNNVTSGLGISSAKGNVFASPGLHAYANSVVDRPTIFPFARGVGLMGEAGPEAIMPLKRGPDGTLGVRGGGGSNVVVNIHESPGKGGQRQERQEGGTTIIDIMVEQIESKLASNTMRGQGPLYAANKQAFGLSRSPGSY